VVPVHIVITRRDVGMGIRALRSLLAYNDQPLRLVWHEDVLDARDIDRINAAFPANSEVLRRRVADEMMDEVLRDYPLCREFRRRHCLGLKLIDPLHDPSDIFMIYDSDIVTMKPVAGFTTLPDDQTDLVFMYNGQYSYIFKLEQAFSVGSDMLVRRLNAGCMLVRRRGLSYAQIESLFEKYPSLCEQGDDQTVWALLAARLNSRMWNPEQVGFPSGKNKAVGQHAVLHCVSPVRAMFDRCADVSEGSRDALQRVTLQTLPCVRFGGWPLFFEILTRRLINYKNRLKSELPKFGR
jgi:hypothetical protein